MTELSPQAQAVRHAAICAGPELEGRIAAALQAAADQLSRSKFIYTPQLLAIAAEMEGGND